MHNKILRLLLIAISTFLSACSLFDKEEPLPAYLYVSEFSLTTDYLSQGTASQRITDCWVFVDEQLIGAFELPARIPILKYGNRKINVSAGIMLNGIEKSRAAYPFYKPVIFDIDLQPGKVDTLSPTTTYQTFADFEYMEDFESPGISLTNTVRSDTTVLQISDPAKVFEGSKCMGIYLDDTKRVFEGTTIQTLNLPTRGEEVFMEMNFKSNNSFSIGLTVIAPDGLSVNIPYLVLNPNTNWRKIYINFTPVTGAQPAGSRFKLFIASTQDNPGTLPEILIDNIKVIQ